MFSCGNSDFASLDEIVSNHVMPCADGSSLYARVDRLLDSNDNDKCTAFNELICQENLVCLFEFLATYYSTVCFLIADGVAKVLLEIVYFVKNSLIILR